MADVKTGDVQRDADGKINVVLRKNGKIILETATVDQPTAVDLVQRWQDGTYALLTE